MASGRDPVRGIPLFARLPEEALDRIANEVARSRHTINPGGVIAERGSPMEKLMLLLDGTAHAEISTIDGHAMTVENFRSPDVIGMPMLFAPTPHFPVSVVALSRCTCAHYQRSALLDLAQRYRSALEAILADAGRRTSFLATRLKLAQFASLRQRIAVFISEAKIRADENGLEHIYIPHSRQELADMFGVARPSLSRELAHMSDEGLIRVNGNRLQVKDRQAIAALVTGCE